jgi:small subunit ribosomal protein S9
LAVSAEEMTTSPVSAKPKKKSAPKSAPTHFWGTGRRKTSHARVRVLPGTGKVSVNGRAIEDYFLSKRDLNAALKPLEVTELGDRYDVVVDCHGGGLTGQAGAMLLGLARALWAADESVESRLREEGLLTRDSRMRERKKYGQKGARASFQFSKR